MIRIIVELLPKEAKALREMCRHFQFGDAQHLLRHSPNVRPDTLCEALTRLREALDPPRSDSPNTH
jgi:hypothetical protein